MERIKIKKRPKLKNPYLICAWPGMGEVAFRAATYLVEQLKAQEFAEIMPEDFFYLSGSVIQEGILSAPQLPYSKFYYYKSPLVRKKAKEMNSEIIGRDLIIFLSNAQPDLVLAEQYSQLIIHMAKSYKVERIVGFAAMPQPIEYSQNPRVWYAATSEKIKKELQQYNLVELKEGQISGMNGLFLGLAKRQGLEGFCLLGEIPFYAIQIENPKASLAVLEVLTRMLQMSIDFSLLREQAQLIEEEISRLLEYIKVGAQEGQPGPIGEEEIEKIKKALSQLTRIPPSIRERIEELFVKAKQDLKHAHELKAELDRWSVYKEYEDRFLDLFKKKNEKNN